MEILNDIVVKFTTYNANVEYDIYEDSLLLFDNSSLIETLPLPGLVFTGIKLVYNDLVKLECYDIEMKKVEYSFWNGYLFLEFKGREACICSTKFVPKEVVDFIEEFKPHFLEVSNESI